MRKKLLTCLFLLVPFFTFAQRPIIERFKAERLFVKGLKEYQGGNYSQAITTLDEVISMDNRHDKAFELRGDAQYALKNYEAAIENYYQAVDLHPEDGTLWFNMGVAAAQNRNYPAAANFFLKTLEIEPDNQKAEEYYQKAKLKADQNGGEFPDPYSDWVANNSNYYNYGQPNQPYGGSYDQPYDPYGTGGGDPYGTGDQSTPYNNPYNNPYDPYGSDPQKDPYGTNPYGNNDPYGTTKNPTTTRSEVGGRLPREVSGEQSYKPKVGWQTDQYLTIKNIKITERSTLITFHIVSTSRQSFPIQLDDIGGANAWYLTDREFKERYELRDIKRLSGWPDKPFTLKPGKGLTFHAEFERLPDDLHFFHLLEGSGEREGSWDFYDIELKALTGTR
ncbi:MAG: tetratricopeptide repeat protein [Bacteroidota bacterium]